MSDLRGFGNPQVFLELTAFESKINLGLLYQTCRANVGDRDKFFIRKSAVSYAVF
jgi:hypothetical protein